MELIGTLLFVFLLAVLVIYRVSLVYALSLFVAFLIGFSVLDLLPDVVIALGWIVFFVIAIAFAIPANRRRWITKPLFTMVHKSFPSMSQTEREAIDAGDVWWEGELFSGKPRWKTLLAYPEPKLNQEEKHFLSQQVTTFCKMLDDWQIHRAQNLPQEAWDYLKKEHFFGIVIPKEYGGLGFSALAHSSIVMKIATRSIAAAITTMVPNSLGPGELLHKYGTEEQKNHYLPRLACGDEIPCFALTSLDAGSDAGSMVDEGVLSYGQFEGKSILGIKLNFSKRYITLAPVATLIGLAFKLYDPEHLLGDQDALGITLALIPAKHKGVEIGNRHNPLTVPFMNGPIRGEDVFIPLEWIIGGKENIGHGWRMLMECLSAGRGISLPSISTASGKLLYQATGAYARIRRQFKIPVSQFEGVQESLAAIAGQTYILNAMRDFVAGSVAQGNNPAIASAIAKYHMTEMSRDVINKSMDIHGGRAIQSGPDNYLFSPYLSIPIGITVEGANILTRNLIIFGQGAIRCHPYLLKEMQLLEHDTQENIQKFDVLLRGHIGFIFSNLLKTLVYGVTAGNFIPVQSPKPLKKYFRQMTRISCALALLSDLSFGILGGRIKRKEALSARLGDVLSHLFMASAVLKHFHEQKYPKQQSSYVHWCMRYHLWHCQEAIIAFLDNFPMHKLAWCVKKMIFPFGRSYKAPSDQLHHQIVKHMLEKGCVRKHLTQGTFLDKHEDNAIGALEIAFEKAIVCTGLNKRIKKARDKKILPEKCTYGELIRLAISKHVITEEEAKHLQEFEALRIKVLSVNEFSHDLSKVVK